MRWLMLAGLSVWAAGCGLPMNVRVNAAEVSPRTALAQADLEMETRDIWAQWGGETALPLDDGALYVAAVGPGQIAVTRAVDGQPARWSTVVEVAPFRVLEPVSTPSHIVLIHRPYRPMHSLGLDEAYPMFSDPPRDPRRLRVTALDPATGRAVGELRPTPTGQDGDDVRQGLTAVSPSGAWFAVAEVRADKIPGTFVADLWVTRLAELATRHHVVRGVGAVQRPHTWALAISDQGRPLLAHPNRGNGLTVVQLDAGSLDVAATQAGGARLEAPRVQYVQGIPWLTFAEHALPDSAPDPTMAPPLGPLVRLSAMPLAGDGSLGGRRALTRSTVWLAADPMADQKRWRADSKDEREPWRVVASQPLADGRVVFALEQQYWNKQLARGVQPTLFRLDGKPNEPIGHAAGWRLDRADFLVLLMAADGQLVWKHRVPRERQVLGPVDGRPGLRLAVSDQAVEVLDVRKPGFTTPHQVKHLRLALADGAVQGDLVLTEGVTTLPTRFRPDRIPLVSFSGTVRPGPMGSRGVGRWQGLVLRPEKAAGPPDTTSVMAY